jgi:hypothetical protein
MPKFCRENFLSFNVEVVSKLGIIVVRDGVICMLRIGSARSQVISQIGLREKFVCKLIFVDENG